MVFIEDVFCIVLFVQERQRQGRFRVWIHIDATGFATIIIQELDYHPSYAVVARFADEAGFCTSPAKRYDSIECRTSGNSLNGLFVAEDG